MDRRLKRYGYPLLGALLAAALLPVLGCVSGLTTAMYLIKGDTEDPEFPGLKNKRVAVVCRSTSSLQYRDARAAKDLGLVVGRMLATKGKKIEVIEQAKVDRWADENTWEEYSEVGKALDAQMVIGIELEYFDIYQGQTLYQGKANVSISVYDVEHGNKLVFEKTPPQVLWPPNSSIPTSEKQAAQFRREFLKVVADRIGKNFYPFDPNEDFAQDAVAAGL